MSLDSDARARTADEAETELVGGRGEDRRVGEMGPAGQPHPLDDLIGREFGAYKVQAFLGRGGMGRVYLAQHQELHRACALKLLAPSRMPSDSEFVARFKNEGRAAAGLNHPNVVTIHNIGEIDGVHFLEMEFVPGRSLQQLIRNEGRLSPIRSTALAARVAEGLAAAHRQSIVHRDLKPDNVLLTHQGIPKIADFGLAKRVTGAPSESHGRGLFGTPSFMAPELLQGDPATTASDVYALGVSYYHMLTGRYPFQSESLADLIQQATTAPVPDVHQFADVPLEMAECLGAMLSKNPKLRPADGVAAAELLRAIQGQLRDIEDLLRAAFGSDSDVRWIRCDDRFRLEIQLPDARRQILFVEPSTHAAADRLLLIYSICCDADPAYFEYALRLNSEIPHGGLAIREIDGKPVFVMSDTYPRATVDAEEIRRSALEVAYRADAVERLLTGLDRH